MVICPTCEEEYVSLGKHFTGSCDRPSLSEKTKETCIAIMIGDGTIDNQPQVTNARLSLTNTKEEYVDYSINQLPNWLVSNKHCLKRDSPQQDVYRLRTIGHPYFTELYTSWYQDGEMKLDQLHLTPLILKHWYAADGNYSQNGPNMNITIGSKFAQDQFELLEDLFFDIDISLTHQGYGSFGISQYDHDKFFEYIGYDPVPGYAYKWP